MLRDCQRILSHGFCTSLRLLFQISSAAPEVRPVSMEYCNAPQDWSTAGLESICRQPRQLRGMTTIGLDNTLLLSASLIEASHCVYETKQTACCNSETMSDNLNGNIGDRGRRNYSDLMPLEAIGDGAGGNEVYGSCGSRPAPAPESIPEHKPSSPSLTDTLPVGDQIRAGSYLVFTDRPMSEIMEKAPGFFETTFFCLNPYKTCAKNPIAEGSTPDLKGSCKSCWILQDNLWEILSPHGCNINLVHWGPGMEQHATVVGPTTQLGAKQLAGIVFGKFPGLRDFFYLHITETDGAAVQGSSERV